MSYLLKKVKNILESLLKKRNKKKIKSKKFKIENTEEAILLIDINPSTGSIKRINKIKIIKWTLNLSKKVKLLTKENEFDHYLFI